MPKDKEASPERKCCVVAAPGSLRKASLGKLQHQSFSESTTRGTRRILHLPLSAEMRSDREEPKDLFNLTLAFPPTSPGPCPFSFQASLTDKKFEGNAIRGLIFSVQDEDHVEGLPTAHNQLIILKLIRVVLSAVLVRA